jgi:N6-adenosine-specific RNA methylase IME4
MSLEELARLPVEALAADDACLFLWSVCPELSGALEIIRAWGFTFKTVVFGWVKTTRRATHLKTGKGLHWGMGHWSRANIECCLLATRGSPECLAPEIVGEVIMAPVAKHSEKPEEAVARIERIASDPYLELFARRPLAGWTTWGNEVTRESFYAPAAAIGGARRMTGLAGYDGMCRAIDAVHLVDEAKEIRDQAMALEVYARQAKNVEAEQKAREIRIRAERKAGQISAKMAKAPGQRTDRQPRGTTPRGSTKAEQLRNAGISVDQAKLWEKLAAVPQQNFDASLADKTRVPTTNGIIRENAPPKPANPVSAEAIWLWERLKDFELDGFSLKIRRRSFRR